MRYFTMSLAVLAMALAVTGCSGGKSSSSDSGSSDQSSSTTSSASSNMASSTTGSSDASGGASSVGDIPAYPGAATDAQGSSSNMGRDAAGKVMSTSDSFDKVYSWYQQKMPSGSEKSHTDAPVQSAVFMIGDTSSGQTSVTLTTQGGKTMISIARVKM